MPNVSLVFTSPTMFPFLPLLYVTSHLLAFSCLIIVASKIEILPAGEEGPRKLDQTTVSIVQGLPFLSTSEFIRAKIRAWSLYVLRNLLSLCPCLIYAPARRRSSDNDAQDIIWALNRYWKSVDINRIPDQDMERFVLQYPAAGPAWTAIKSLYSA